MAVRTFNGSTDFITCAIGGVTAVGPLTLAVLMKEVSDTGEQTPLGFTTSAGTNTGSWAIGHLATTFLHYLTNGAGNNDTGTMTIRVSDGWVLLVVTKASGLAHAVNYKFPLGGAWTTDTGTSTTNNNFASLAGGNALFGTNTSGGKFYNGRLAVVGVWNVAMTLAQAEALNANLRTSDFWNSAAGRPQGLWEFNQASTATPVPDLTGGGANQSAIAGTTVTTVDDPPGWTFDGLGVVAAPPLGPPVSLGNYFYQQNR